MIQGLSYFFLYFCILLKGGDLYYTQAGDLDVIITALKSQLPIDCWWYSTYGKRFEEEIVFYDEEQIVMVRSESDASPLEEM